MQVINDEVVWSASDLTAATACEYAIVRRLDVLLHGVDKAEVKDDPLLAHIAKLGLKHEAQVLTAYAEQGRQVWVLETASTRDLAQAARETEALLGGDEILTQACFFDAEFLGYADFLEPSSEGWVVCDAKLARQAQPKALLQLAAYADQVARLGLPVAPDAVLILGTGERQSFSLREVGPVFRERRERLRSIIAEHRAGGQPVAWGDDRYTACGGCPDCVEAISQTADVWQVAGMRSDQRRKLREAGIRSVGDLAAATERPVGMAQATFENLRAQAVMQARQLATGEVTWELRADAAAALTVLPAASKGDLFFDFEGDPLYQEPGASRWGLEYLWGIVETSSTGEFRPLWAHNWEQERTALVTFMDYVAERRATHPDLHIYHYAPYEVTALKRLVAVHQTHEAELDDLLRSGVFVDLYATVRGAIRVSQPSYSIKKLEPLYMPAREGDVQAGDVSIAEYHEYRTLVEEGDTEAAEKRLQALASYNRDDCVSTVLLRDWLLDRAAEVGGSAKAVAIDRPGGPDEEFDELHATLLSRVGVEPVAQRSAEQQAWALLANAMGFHRREDKPWWWAYYERLSHSLEEWQDERDVFTVESADVVDDWAVTGQQKKPRRTLRLTGDWSPGSTPGCLATVIYQLPAPAGADVPEQAVLGALGRDVTVAVSDDDARVVQLTESCSPGQTHDVVPVALMAAQPPMTTSIRAAIREVAATCATGGLVESAAIDVLLQRPPRLVVPGSLPRSGDNVVDVVAALTAMQDSYVAVQGPPGTGKSWTGARVIKRLVEEHGWKVGVVAQSHIVVEGLLDGIVDAGLDAARIVKAKAKTAAPAWTPVTETAKIPGVLACLGGGGYVLGGTAWDFTGRHVERGSLDLLVIDEAGQFALAPTIGVSVAAPRLLLLGDPQQLPQVTQGTHAEPVGTSALGWLMTGHDTLPEELGYFLGTSYRMHPALCARVSEFSYDGRLSSAPSAASRSLEGVDPGLRIVAIDHLDCRTESAEEAAEVLAQIQSMLGTVWSDSGMERGLEQGDFLVVAPFNAQVNLIRRALGKAGLSGVRVGTVDKFQGREAPVVLVSMTASSHGDVPRGMGFLLNRNRVNVAISRAQWLAVVVRSRALTSYLPNSTDGLLELGAFAGLCET